MPKLSKSDARLAEHVRNPIDVHVGSRVRLQRKHLGMRQEELAEAIGLTFQQVQKYERGTNRVSASKLYNIARVLQVPIAFFYEGLADTREGADADEVIQQAERAVKEFLATEEGMEMAEVFPRIPIAFLRRQVLDLVRAMAEAEGMKMVRHKRR